MNSRRTRVDVDYMHTLYCFFHFIQRSTVTQYPRNKLKVGDCIFFFRSIVVFVFSIRREVEQSGRQSGFVYAFSDKFLLFYGKSYITISCRKLHSVDSFRSVRLCRISSWNNNILAVQVASAPFDGTCNDCSSVFAFQCDTCTGICRL